MGPHHPFSGHENIRHAEVEQLAYDWDRAADPEIAPKRPFRVYMPENTQELSEAIQEINDLKARGRISGLRVRSRGHSSNDLVLAERDQALVLTEFLRSDELDILEDGTAWVGAGEVLADLDTRLEAKGWGLPVIGDHNHITAGGFASVGGVSPSSNKHGLFIDTIEEIEVVGWDGQVRHLSRAQEREFYRVLGGMGKFGIMGRLRCRLLQVRKHEKILHNDRRVIWGDMEAFLDVSEARILKRGDPPNGGDQVTADPPGNLVHDAMERGLWLDYVEDGLPMRVRVGQYSTYGETVPTRWSRFWNWLTHKFLHRIGLKSGLRPPLVDKLMMFIGMGGLIYSPKHASVKNIEVFADRIIDTAVGGDHRMMIAFAPVENYRKLFYELNELCLEFRDRGCLTYFMIYVKSMHSNYLCLAGDVGPERRYCEYVVYIGVVPEKMNHQLANFAARMDDLCRAADTRGMRYMHTRTVPLDDPRRKEIDPNELVAATLERRNAKPA